MSKKEAFDDQAIYILKITELCSAVICNVYLYLYLKNN